MSKKIPFAVAIALILIFSALTVILTVSVYLRSYNKILISVYQRSQQFSALSDIDEIIKDNYYGEVKYDSAMTGAASGYLSSLDGECAYLTAGEYAEFSANNEGSFPGVGLTAEFDSENNALIVTSVINGSPAYNSGIEIGDFITEIDSSEISLSNQASFIERLSGRDKTEIRLKIRKAPEETETLIELTPVYRLSSVSYQKSGSIGYIKLSAFYSDTSDLFKKAVNALMADSITGLIIDVRNIKSFNYEYAADVIDVIVPLATEGNGAIATALDYQGKSIAVYSADAASVNIPLSVLINDRSEGAAELLAADLRDFSKAVLIGENTAGNASYQKAFSLESGAVVVLTVAKICPYISECFDGSGVSPDIEIPMSESAKDALDSADISNDELFKAGVSALS
ncbi:MAG: PDZ domain-containing protein [Oscillospiraceae bacterium]|nr:PDZ domain-containing protein [Oscillospiraceae bacterium]